MLVTLKQCYGVVMGGLGLFSLIGYGFVALTLCRRPDLRKNNYFLISLAFSDFFIFIHLAMISLAAFNNDWPFGDLGCQIDAFMGMASTLISICNISWIARDRYVRIEASANPSEKSRHQYQIAFIWVSGIVAGALPFYGFGKYGFETEDPTWQTGCMLDFTSVGLKYYIYIVGICIYWFVLPLYNIIWYYKKISMSDKTALQMQHIVPLQFLVSFSPYAIYALVSITVGVSVAPHYFTAVNNVAAKIFICTNPYIYVQSDAALLNACCDVMRGKGEASRQKNA